MYWIRGVDTADNQPDRGWRRREAKMVLKAWLGCHFRIQKNGFSIWTVKTCWVGRSSGWRCVMSFWHTWLKGLGWCHYSSVIGGEGEHQGYKCAHSKCAAWEASKIENRTPDRENICCGRKNKYRMAKVCGRNQAPGRKAMNKKGWDSPERGYSTNSPQASKSVMGWEQSFIFEHFSKVNIGDGNEI